MPLRIRKRRNLARGTEINYATIPLEEAKNIDEQSVRQNLERFYGPSVNYTKLAEEIRTVSSEGKQREREFVPIEDEKKNSSEEGRDYVTLRVVGKKSPRVFITPTPRVHDMWYGHGRFNTTRFGALMGIVKHGFNSLPWRDNALVKKQKAHRFNWDHWDKNNIVRDEGSEITKGDRYSLEMYPDEGKDYGPAFLGEPTYGIIKAKPERILSVNIGLNPDATPEEREKKMGFYQKQIAQKCHVPVRFYESSWGNRAPLPSLPEEEVALVGKRIYPRRKNLEQTVSAVIGIIGLLGSIFFLSSNVTGNAVGLSNGSFSLNGIILFILGLISTLFYFRARK